MGNKDVTTTKGYINKSGHGVKGLGDMFIAGLG